MPKILYIYEKGSRPSPTTQIPIIVISLSLLDSTLYAERDVGGRERQQERGLNKIKSSKM